MQVQCPNCGGYKIAERLSAMDASGKVRDKSDISSIEERIVWLWILGIVFLIGGIGIVLIIWAIISGNEVRALNKLFQNGPRNHEYTCQICGKYWSWWDNQPYPYSLNSNVNSNLQQLGEQRLIEEEMQMRAAYGAEQERIRREQQR